VEASSLTTTVRPAAALATLSGEERAPAGPRAAGPRGADDRLPLAFWIEAALVVAAIVVALVVVRGGPRDEEVRAVDEPHRDRAAYAEA
jgi:hypothetical protein